MELIKRFIAEVKENGRFWLLEAKPGLFAMLEDAEANPFIPVWSNENDAVQCTSEDWEGYSVTTMSISEFTEWMKELSADNIGIAILIGGGEQMLPLPAMTMKQLFSGMEIDEEADRNLVGEEFYDEDWAEGIPDNWEEDFLDNLEDEE